MSDTESTFEIQRFHLDMLTEHSKVVFLGRKLNYRMVFKDYRNYFESAKQVKELFASLQQDDNNTFLVIDLTKPNSQIEDVIFTFRSD